MSQEQSRTLPAPAVVPELEAWSQLFSEAGVLMQRAMKRADHTNCFSHFLTTTVDVLELFGIRVDRVAMPFNRHFGFLHPVWTAVLLSWSRESGISATYRSHEELVGVELRDIVSKSPYRGIVLEGKPTERFDLTRDDLQFEIHRELKAQGYIDYLAVPLPSGKNMLQPFGIASKVLLPEHTLTTIGLLQPFLSMSLEAFYSSSRSQVIARSYIGPHTGQRVLKGELFRGKTSQLRAGILFCDIRNFTAITQSLGAQETVNILNRIFELLGSVVERRGGEILKFIGDAVLIVFPADHFESSSCIGEAMLGTVQDSLSGLERLSDELQQPLGLGFGGHLGEVFYGNIGTRERLDFTIIGHAVNLCSRLESLCKPLGVRAVFSAEVGSPLRDLEHRGAHAVKGVQAPVDVYCLP